jgi:microcystin-dependent protein
MNGGVMGTVICFAGDFVPTTWAACNGQSVSVSQNQALFSILGTIYGGDGVNNFNLPDMRGRTAVSQGQGIGTNNYTMGQPYGSESSMLTVNNLPAHTHSGAIQLQLQACSDDGTEPTPNDGYPARFTGAYALTTDSNMILPTYPTAIVGNTGNNQPIDIRSPYLVVNYIICTTGIFPSRN